MQNSLFKWTMRVGMAVLIALLPMLLFSLLPVESTQRFLLRHYLAIPFFLLLSLFFILLALYIGKQIAMNSRCRLSSRLLASFLALGLIFFGLWGANAKVLSPLRDIPYLSAPSTIQLQNVTFIYSSTEPGVTLLQGQTEQGDFLSFSIDSGIYARGEAILHSNAATSLSAEIAYLPYSETVVTATFTPISRA